MLTHVPCVLESIVPDNRKSSYDQSFVLLVPERTLELIIPYYCGGNKILMISYISFPEIFCFNSVTV